MTTGILSIQTNWGTVQYRLSILNSNLTKSCLSKTCFSFPIILNFFTEHGSDTAMLCAKFQDDWTIDTDVMDEQDFGRFEFKMSFRQLSYVAQHPGRFPNKTIYIKQILSQKLTMYGILSPEDYM